MASKMEEIEKEALLLSIDERSSLIHKLIISLEENEKEDQNVTENWNKEIKQRYENYKTGKSKAIPAEEVLEKLKSRLK